MYSPPKKASKFCNILNLKLTDFIHHYIHKSSLQFTASTVRTHSIKMVSSSAKLSNLRLVWLLLGLLLLRSTNIALSILIL